MSKGSKQRPMDVSLDMFQENFDRIFKEKKKRREENETRNEEEDEDTKRKSER